MAKKIEKEIEELIDEGQEVRQLSSLPIGEPDSFRMRYREQICQVILSNPWIFRSIRTLRLS